MFHRFVAFVPTEVTKVQILSPEILFVPTDFVPGQVTDFVGTNFVGGGIDPRIPNVSALVGCQHTLSARISWSVSAPDNVLQNSLEPVFF